LIKYICAPRLARSRVIRTRVPRFRDPAILAAENFGKRDPREIKARLGWEKSPPPPPSPAEGYPCSLSAESLLPFICPPLLSGRSETSSLPFVLLGQGGSRRKRERERGGGGNFPRSRRVVAVSAARNNRGLIKAPGQVQ
jgi:hypothetical protein